MTKVIALERKSSATVQMCKVCSQALIIMSCDQHNTFISWLFTAVSLDFLVDHRTCFTSAFIVPLWVSTQLLLALVSRAVQNDWLNGWIIHLSSSGLSQTPTIALSELFPPSGMLLSQIYPSKTQSLCPLGKRKARAGCLDWNFDQHQLAHYLPVIKTMKRRPVFISSTVAMLK